MPTETLDLEALRCFVAVAEDLHFGRAAQALGILPATLGQRVRQLEDRLGVRLLTRTTRFVALTTEGAALVPDAIALLRQSDLLVEQAQRRTRGASTSLRIGAIDTAAAGLVPQLLRDLRRHALAISAELTEEKTVRLLPKVLSGRLDLVFVRPPERLDRRLEAQHLLYESPVVAVPRKHRLADRTSLRIGDLEQVAMILPDRRTRPHSHRLTISLFAGAGLTPKVAQIADEKQTILNLVSAGIGIAIVPRWTTRMAVPGVRYIRLRREATTPAELLPIAAVWLRGASDPTRDQLLGVLRARISAYSRTA